MEYRSLGTTGLDLHVQDAGRGVGKHPGKVWVQGRLSPGGQHQRVAALLGHFVLTGRKVDALDSGSDVRQQSWLVSTVSLVCADSLLAVDQPVRARQGTCRKDAFEAIEVPSTAGNALLQRMNPPMAMLDEPLGPVFGPVLVPVVCEPLAGREQAPVVADYDSDPYVVVGADRDRRSLRPLSHEDERLPIVSTSVAEQFLRLDRVARDETEEQDAAEHTRGAALAQQSPQQLAQEHRSEGFFRETATSIVQRCELLALSDD